MSKSYKQSRHLGKGEAKKHDRSHKHARYDMHKLAVAVSHNRYERDHGGESAKGNEKPAV